MDTIFKFLHSIMFTLTLQISKLTKAVVLNSFPHGRFWQFVYKENVMCTRLMQRSLQVVIRHSLNEFIFIINPMRSCNERTTLHCVESYLYYIILARSETREKKNRQYIYIVENMKFIYTSFDEFFLPVSQRVEMNYKFSDNVRILYLSPRGNCQIV